ncbi:hypothetical protein K7E08_08715 [Ligilactobacillus salivarius]|uniref:hypothetical protein n=1 Tax=Ligilactobacillus salivarius TaxID=1624 RepID=UPI001CBF7190|nr:hypothetical protein [Ligilactobacillus salivarius]MBZ4030993.1 hypothetical protein [Ligilactobacillus salivarius]
MSKDYIVTLSLGESKYCMYAIATCQGSEFVEDKITHILPFNIIFTEKGGNVELQRKLTIEQFKEWGLWKIKSVEGDSLTDFMEVIAPIVRPFEEDDWKPTRELTVDDFESVDE